MLYIKRTHSLYICTERFVSEAVCITHNPLLNPNVVNSSKLGVGVHVVKSYGNSCSFEILFCSRLAYYSYIIYCCGRRTLISKPQKARRNSN